MQDSIFIRFHEIILLIYVLSIGFYFIDFIKHNYKVKMLGVYTLGIVWVLQTISLTMFIIETRDFPFGSISEVFNVLTWLIILVSLITHRIKRLDFSIFLLNLIGFTLLTLHTFQPTQYSSGGLRLEAVNELLMIHISLAIVSYVAFAFAFVNGLLFLVQYRNLKEKRFDHSYFRIGSVAFLEQLLFYSTLTGFIILVLSLILGGLWGLFTIGSGILLDPKVISSSIIALLYGIFIYLFVRRKLNPKHLIYINIVLFLLCMINMIVITQLSTFHQWTGK
ncbi:cytochrome C assembly family protein [Staphylococcus massiliensis]|uniref:Cytochrome c assembly protein domain-containing protein n=1 Tax=Staphylococcus massiliensis S46 TaxID=1229783 RepID=K9AS70_9STAP|nr:cytochrome c biogenesis protein CcsA [Staphylococcus massiliensis]EKU50179.1 hypothetical protein C273_01005 [Staphylococcus massiliensis S46]MCG3399105.1 cytochrome c biogenesis protein [Staphylococcus massiliensis]MCG3400897.1 cytochrome c biogenesis protein [Staphylococcus massiliensis]POA01662.1 cytochrome C assembly protein [Staphylococcus massiliensis CCUG 55927]